MKKHDHKYRAWLASLPCCACGRGAPSQVHHTTGAGMGLKSDDSMAMPLCLECHQNLHTFQGEWKWKNRHERAEWQRSQAAKHVSRYECLHR